MKVPFPHSVDTPSEFCFLLLHRHRLLLFSFLLLLLMMMMSLFGRRETGHGKGVDFYSGPTSMFRAEDVRPRPAHDLVCVPRVLAVRSAGRIR